MKNWNNLQIQCSTEERREGNDAMIGASYSIFYQKKKMCRMEQGESSETWEIYIGYFWVMEI